jgi:cyclophilin family peptidyl-prolyl cis-trans isomerase/HEAT repeat protein
MRGIPLRRNTACLALLSLTLALPGTMASAAVAPLTPLEAIARAEDQRNWTDGVLQHALTNTDPAIRARAALAVGRLQDSTSVAALLPLLQDKDLPVRREAVFALGQIGIAAPVGTAALARVPLQALLPGADEPTADLTLEALGKLGDKAATPVVVSFLTNASPLLRGEAAVALWRLADSTALQPLLQRHDDPDPEVRWRVLYALEKIHAPDQIVLVCALHMDDAEWLTRAYAARTMGRQKSARATAYLLQKVHDPDAGVAVMAIRAVQQVADSTCGPCTQLLVDALKAGNPPYVRVTAATALADRFAWVSADSTVRKNALGALADAVKHDPDPATRGAAARALLARRGESALDDVRPLLADTSIYTRVAVLQALTLLPEPVAWPLLLERVKPGNALFERETALDALGTLKARGTLPAVRAALTDTATLVVASAAGALAEMGDSTSVRALVKAYAARAGDADADARIALRDALRALAPRAYVDSVEHAHPARNATQSYGPEFFAAPDKHGAILHTTAGDIEWAFDGDVAPQTVKNFIRLAERGYFNGLAIHRVVPNFVIQDGDPTGTGSGGPGYTIRCEYNQLRYTAGMVGMALSGKDTGGSQWFITHSPQLHLNGRYTIFAHVTRGMDVVNRIVQGDRVVKVDLLP